MLKIRGRMYVKGTVDISRAALARLKEMGVIPPPNPWPQGGQYDSFFLPEGEEGEEFLHHVGTPASAGDLWLKSERDKSR